MKTCNCIGFVCSLAFGLTLGAADAITLDVRAGERARRDTPVRWEMPAAVKLPSAWRLLRADDRKEVPAQLEVGPPAALVWILEGDLAPMAKRRYLVEPATGSVVEAAKVSTSSSKTEGGAEALTVAVAGKPVLRYNSGEVKPPAGVEPEFARSGYIHPLWSPAGRAVTNDFPLNHKHHHGVWMPWSQTEIEGRATNFWEQNRLEGKVECVRAAPISGPVFGGVSAAHRFIDLKRPGGPKAVIDETWELRVYARSGPRLIDFTSHQACASDIPIFFKQYRYGGFGFRGPLEWEGKDGCEFLTSQGRTRQDGHETAAWWCDVSGKVGGDWTGVAFLCHPLNFRAPQNMRIHDTEPFFNYTPCQDGDFEMRPGKPLTSRYRFVVHDGKLDAQELDRLWWDYAKPPEVIWVHGEGP